MGRKLYLLGFICIWASPMAIAQATTYKLLVTPVDSAAAKINLQSHFKNREQLESYVQALPQKLLGLGYLSVSIDSFFLDSSKAIINLYAGKRYAWGTITYPQEYTATLTAISGTKSKKNKPVYINPAEDYKTRIFDYLEDNGYPFATVKYDSVVLTGNTLSGKLVVDKGNFYKIDSIAQLGSLRFKKNFLPRYLAITPGSPFQQSKLKKIAQRLDELPFARQTQPWHMDLLGTGGVINTFLETKRSNVFNALLGVMPASSQTPGNKTLLTGDVNLLLRNSFRSGETIGFNWQQIQYQSPRLNLLFQQPYLFGSKAGADFFFELFRKDTQFVNLQVRLGMPYEFSIEKTGKVFFHYHQTTVGTVDTLHVLRTGQLPDLADTRSTSLGLDFSVNTTNYRLNPRMGQEWSLHIMGGTKRVMPSSDILNLKDPSNPGFDFAGLYDSIALNTHQVRIRFLGAHYLPIGRFSVMKFGLQAGLFESGNFFRNELFQIGGFRLLRGFDEESIFARQYAVFTTEYRLLTGKNGYFFGFADGGWAQYRDELIQFGHTYLGTGLGLALETKNSLINISWAIGKRNDLPFDLRQSKIHLGFINFF